MPLRLSFLERAQMQIPITYKQQMEIKNMFVLYSTLEQYISTFAAVRGVRQDFSFQFA